MLGAIVGDIAGSCFEGKRGVELKTYNLPLSKIFSGCARATDDSVLLAATAQAMLDESDDFSSYYKLFARQHPNAGYGPGFSSWLRGENTQYQSFGNGAAVRAGVLGYLTSESDVLYMARKSAEVSHQHDEGIAGAESMAWVIWAVRQGISKDEISQELYQRWNYYVSPEPSHDLLGIRMNGGFDSSAVNTVPISMFIALFSATTFVKAIRSTHYIGGDVDTMASMAGLIKAQYETIPPEWETQAKRILWKKTPKILETLEQFEAKYEQFHLLPF